MRNLRSILSLMLFAQCNVFAADPLPQPNEHFDDWGSLLVTLLEQGSLQPHLIANSTYSLKYVNKWFYSFISEFISELRARHIKQPISITEKRNTGINKTVELIALHDKSYVLAKSVIWDASGEKAYAVLEKEPVLCCFSWPSRELLHKKQLLVCDTMVWNFTSVKTFFDYRMGYFVTFRKDHADIICYLPTGYMHIRKDYGEWEQIQFRKKIDNQSGRPTMLLCKSCNCIACSWPHECDDPRTIFTADTNAIIKDSEGVIIPWQKIEWDECAATAPLQSCIIL